MMDMQVPFYKHSLSPEHAQAVAKVLESSFLTSGPVCKEVEAQLDNYFGVKHSKLVNSWTNGAVATLLALDIGSGDEVIVPSMTFIATANVVELVGAKPIFIDCDPSTLLITPELVKQAITSKTKAVIPVHMYGQMCDVKAIKEILPKNQKIYLIEDCAHSFESKFNGERPGKHSDAAIFSFYATKNITCGEGGAIITNDSNIYERIVQAVHHGMSASAADRFKAGHYNHWGMEHLGAKANLSDLLACLLPDQILKIDNQIENRESKANYYEKSLQSSNFKIPKALPNALHARHLFPIGVGYKNRDLAMKILVDSGIGVTVNYRAVTTMKYYKNKYKFQENSFCNSKDWGDETISIPLFPSITKKEQDYVIEKLLKDVQPLVERK